MEADALEKLGDVALRMGQYGQARRLLNRAVEIADRMGDIEKADKARAMLSHIERVEESGLAYPGRPAADIRKVNAWLEGGQQVLWVGRVYRIGIDIGAEREGTLHTETFSEPDWCDEDYFDLSIVLYGEGARVQPAARKAHLPRRGPMEAVFFEVEPRRPGMVELILAIFIASEETLLQKCQFALEVIEASEPSAVRP